MIRNWVFKSGFFLGCDAEQIAINTALESATSIFTVQQSSIPNKDRVDSSKM